MDNIIKQLSEIENHSEQVINDGILRKKELTARYDGLSRQFDEKLEEDTEMRIMALRAELEASMNEQLERQRGAAKKAADRLEEHYELSHVKYVDGLFQKMIEV